VYNAHPSIPESSFTPARIIAAGIALAPADLDRVRQATGRIGFALQEVRS
jgi:hypothetical protein